MVSQLHRGLPQEEYVDSLRVQGLHKRMLEAKLEGNFVCGGIREDRQVVIAHGTCLAGHLRAKQVHQIDFEKLGQDVGKYFGNRRHTHDFIIA